MMARPASQPPSAMTSRRLFAAFAAVAVTAAIVYGVYWFVIAGVIRDGIEGWAEARRADGFEVVYEDLAIGGFPTRFVATLSRPRSGGWSAARLVAEARPYDLDRITITVPETQRFDHEGRVMEMTLERGVAHVVMADGMLESLTVEADRIALVTPGGLFSLAGLTGLIRRGPEARLVVEIDGRGLVLASRVQVILGREIGLIGVTASHDGPLPEAWSGPALAAWSTAGGTVEFERLNLEWGAVEIAAEGTLTLDGALRPEAAFSAEIAGYGGLLDLLAEQGRMQPREASFAKTFLNLMAKKKAGRRVLKAPVTAQNGKLFVGPLPLLKLAPVF